MFSFFLNYELLILNDSHRINLDNTLKSHSHLILDDAHRINPDSTLVSLMSVDEKA